VHARSGQTATLLPDGTVLVLGGSSGKFAELYDPTTDRWIATGRLLTPRVGHTATLLADGTVLVVGGYAGADGARTRSAELYDPGTGKWIATGSLLKARGGHTATLLPNGEVLVAGGGGETESAGEGGPSSASAELYDPNTRTWSGTREMTLPRELFTATLLRDGTVLVAGGSPAFIGGERYLPATALWLATGSMVAGRIGHTATLLEDGTVLVAGGCRCGADAESDPTSRSAEIYDPTSDTWHAVGKVSAPGVDHTAGRLVDGAVLVVSGWVPRGALPSAELYDPIEGRWIATASPAWTGSGTALTLLPDGRVLRSGEVDRQGRATAEIYDPGLAPN
jgi:hypothetical protein